MPDPDEGATAEGMIRTGARRDRVTATFEPVLVDAVSSLRDIGGSLYVYGSVATGMARPGTSDVDLLSVDLPGAAALGERLSARYADRCRGVEVAAATAADFEGGRDAAYGARVFLRHYCVHLAGPDRSAGLPAYPADARAARGFNGDLDRHLRRWRERLLADPEQAHLLGVRVARKTLLALAGLVSVHDRTWTTDRSRAVRRWSVIEPAVAPELALLRAWAAAEHDPVPAEVELALAEDGIIAAIVDRFASMIGLWTTSAIR